MILGDSLQVMASLAEREQLRGEVQCIYFDPPYGIRFNSNWQVSTQSREVKDGKQSDISREPEQVKAFRDTWRDGIHSYLTYLRDRLTVARELLTDSGSIFVQIGDENVHRVRAVMDEVFNSDNMIVELIVQKAGSATGAFIQSSSDRVLWYAKKKSFADEKFRPLVKDRNLKGEGGSGYTKIMTGPVDSRPLTKAERDRPENISDQGNVWRSYPLTSDGYRPSTTVEFRYQAGVFHPGKSAHWKVTIPGLTRAAKAGRVVIDGKQISLRRMFKDDPTVLLGSVWQDLGGASDKIYVVQTDARIVERCILMATDPGDLVLDPTCGSGTTAAVAEQWGRRWITIDTSRVALTLARTRLMSALYPYYLLADSPEGRRKEQEVSGKTQPLAATQGDIGQGFVYDRAPHVTLKSIANNAEIDVIYERWQCVLEPLRDTLNAHHGGTPFEDWQIPREAGPGWPAAAREAHARWWEGRITRQREIDASIAKAADVELLYDRPYEDKTRVRVAGPFTVEALSPHRTVPADAASLYDEVDELLASAPRRPAGQGDFAAMILDNLRAAGVQAKDKDDRIHFTSLVPWPGAEGICAEGRYSEGEVERRAAIFLGPEFGTVQRGDLVAAAREATEARFDVLIACAFAYDAHASDLTKLGPLPIVKAKMNPDLHMAGDLKTTGKGNLFIVFGEPDIEIRTVEGDRVQVQVKGIDVFDPNTGDIRSDDTDGIAAWFIDTDYDSASFFVRHAYFLGASDPYKSLKSALRAEVDEAAWATLYSDTSRPFARPSTGRIAVKVINHFGDEVMKVFRT